MDILIIGGSGHVSGATARLALSAGHRVWTVTRGKREPVPGVVSLVADRTDHEAFAAVVEGEGCTWDLVVDCICFDRPDMELDIALFRDRARQFVFISTDFVYDPPRRVFPQPADPACYVPEGVGSMEYGRKKRACECALIEGDTGSMGWTILRPCHIHGPTSELGCLPLHGRDRELIEKLRAGTPLQLVGGGHFLQQPILADDLAATILSVAGNGNAQGRIFNTPGPDIVESWQYYQIIADILGVGLTVEEIPVDTYLAENPDKTPFMCHRIYDQSPLRAAGLHVPATSIVEGLRQHVTGLLARRG
jgi:nucleoside-diphosphate-sugar epimerase